VAIRSSKLGIVETNTSVALVGSCSTCTVNQGMSGEWKEPQPPNEIIPDDRTGQLCYQWALWYIRTKRLQVDQQCFATLVSRLIDCCRAGAPIGGNSCTDETLTWLRDCNINWRNLRNPPLLPGGPTVSDSACEICVGSTMVYLFSSCLVLVTWCAAPPYFPIKTEVCASALIACGLIGNGYPVSLLDIARRWCELLGHCQPAGFVPTPWRHSNPAIPSPTIDTDRLFPIMPQRRFSGQS